MFNNDLLEQLTFIALKMRITLEDRPKVGGKVNLKVKIKKKKSVGSFPVIRVHCHQVAVSALIILSIYWASAFP